MIPIRDTVVSRTPPLVVFALIGLNAVVFVGELALPQEVVGYWLQRLALVPARLTGNDPTAGPALGAVGLVTSQFIHGGTLHILGNMWVLWIFGDNVEDRMGAARFTAFYLLCGIIAGVVHSLVTPHSMTPTIGASGAIAGVMGAYLLLYPMARILFLIPIFFIPLFVELPAFVFLGLWFLMQYFGGLGASTAADGAQQIAFWAHVGGFAAGIVLCYPFLRRPRRAAFADEQGLEGAWIRW